MNSVLILVILFTFVIYLLPRYPDPTVIENFLSESERRHIIQEASIKLETSMISRDKQINESIRKSETAWLNKEDPVVKGVIQRCLKYTDRPFENCEKLQVVRYKPGGHYKPHQDAFKDDKNMRIYTFILALNDGYDGGETEFPNLNKSYKLKAGDALFFDTLNNYDFLTSKALHGGKTVNHGNKWICNLWVRKHKYVK
jgi:alkylated DNA repair dioxygenase AlkB|tara:strand:- start:720 stop:1316 length:597 start_codon:yes stop_codon:yes gene_type:complete